MKRSCRSGLGIRAVLCALILLAPQRALFAQPPPPAAPPPEAPPPGQPLAPNQLDDLVAPIALYPDPLLSQILVAATYPLELVQASQWLARNPSLTGAALTEAAQTQNWDPSVQALVVFPGVVKQLNQDITWTTDLGNAFLSQQADVMDAVQRMRAKAQSAGKLETTPQQVVTTMPPAGSGPPVIEIQPADPQVIYVPTYDPFYVWGPPLYYPYASWYYPPAYFGFGVGIPIGVYFGYGWGGWGGWGWHPGWGGHTVIVNNNFIHRYNFNAGPRGNLSGRTEWSHDAFHREGVPYSNSALSNRYGATARQSLQPRSFAGQSSPRGGTNPSGGERMGNRQIPSNTPSNNRSAFGGVREGGAARMQSDHGFSSLGAGRSGGGAPRGGGGGAPRGGGGRR